MEDESDDYINCNRCTRNDSHRLVQGRRKDENRTTSRDYPKYSIVEVSHNSEKSPGDPRKCAVTPVKDHLLMRK